MFGLSKLSKRLFPKKSVLFSLVLVLATQMPSAVFTSYAASLENATVMENCGAYIFTWRPVDCGNGEYFVILNGQNTISESNVILNRGYDYAYTFDSSQSRPWGTVPDLVNANGVWAIPQNWSSLPSGTQAVSTIVLVTNNGNSSTKERCTFT